MSVTRTQIEGDVRRIQQFIQQVRNFLSGSTVQAVKDVHAGLCRENSTYSSPQLSCLISTSSALGYIHSEGNAHPLRAREGRKTEEEFQQYPSLFVTGCSVPS